MIADGELESGVFRLDIEGAVSSRESGDRMSNSCFLAVGSAQRWFSTARRAARVSGAVLMLSSSSSGSSGRTKALMFQSSNSAAMRSLTLGLEWVSQILLFLRAPCMLWQASAVTKE